MPTPPTARPARASKGSGEAVCGRRLPDCRPVSPVCDCAGAAPVELCAAAVSGEDCGSGWAAGVPATAGGLAWAICAVSAAPSCDCSWGTGGCCWDLGENGDVTPLGPCGGAPAGRATLGAVEGSVAG